MNSIGSSKSVMTKYIKLRQNRSYGHLDKCLCIPIKQILYSIFDTIKEHHYKIS